jgi:hypothetical protein
MQIREALDPTAVLLRTQTDRAEVDRSDRPRSVARLAVVIVTNCRTPKTIVSLAATPHPNARSPPTMAIRISLALSWRITGPRYPHSLTPARRSTRV